MKAFAIQIEPDLNNKGCLDKWRLFFYNSSLQNNLSNFSI